MHRFLLVSRFAQRRCVLPSHTATTATLFTTARATMMMMDSNLTHEASFGRRKNNPVMDVIEIAEEPQNGRMVRAVYSNHCVELAYYPQIGPRKADPYDTTPQFDFQQRVFFRMNKSHMAELLAVYEGKLPSANITTPYGGSLKANLSAARDVMTVDIDVPTRDKAPDNKHMTASLVFKGAHAASFKHFLENALAKSFGFEAGEQQRPFRGNNNDRQNNNNNNKNFNNDRRNNNNNSNNNNN
eukprot:PhM_4_TR5432/c1_g1_i1/m.71602